MCTRIKSELQIVSDRICIEQIFDTVTSLPGCGQDCYIARQLSQRNTCGAMNLYVAQMQYHLSTCASQVSPQRIRKAPYAEVNQNCKILKH